MQLSQAPHVQTLQGTEGTLTPHVQLCKHTTHLVRMFLCSILSSSLAKSTELSWSITLTDFNGCTFWRQSIFVQEALEILVGKDGCISLDSRLKDTYHGDIQIYKNLDQDHEESRSKGARDRARARDHVYASGTGDVPFYCQFNPLMLIKYYPYLLTL